MYEDRVIVLHAAGDLRRSPARDVGLAECAMVERALLEFDLIQSLLAAKKRHEAQNALSRLRRRTKELPAGERQQQGRALIKLGAQLLRDFDKQIALEKRTEEKRRLLTAKCSRCGTPGSETRLTNDSGRVLCLTCHKKFTVKCAACGRAFSKDQMSIRSGRPLCATCRQMPKCTKCGNPFKREKSMPRQRVCGPCGGGQRPTVRTVSGGLPTLGHRR